MGSKSDWATMQKTAEVLDRFGVAYEKKVVSAHRTPDLMFRHAEEARSRGIKVIIAGAGGAAHLPGMVAAKSNTAPTAANAQATAVGTQATVATTTATTATAGYAPIVVQSVTATGVPIQISAEKRSELEQLLAAYGHKKALLYFANNKTVPLAYDPTIIDEMVTMLQAHPELSILLEGYASAVGSTAYNNVLSMERAVAVAQILNAKGIGNERILTAFKGIDPQATPAQARRVELRVVIRSY